VVNADAVKRAIATALSAKTVESATSAVNADVVTSPTAPALSAKTAVIALYATRVIVSNVIRPAATE